MSTENWKTEIKTANAQSGTPNVLPRQTHPNKTFTQMFSFLFNSETTHEKVRGKLTVMETC